MFAGITELTDLESFKLLDYSTERGELIIKKNEKKNEDFADANKLIITGFDAAIETENSVKLQSLLETHGYQDIDADIGQLDAIIKVNSKIKSMKTGLTDLENERDTMINSLTDLNAEKQAKIQDLEPQIAKLTMDVEQLTADVEQLKREKDALNGEFTRANGSLTLEKDKLKANKIQLTELTERIDKQNEEIAKLNVEIIKHTANQNMLDIKIKHYQGLKETSNKAHYEQRNTLQKDIEELKKTIGELEKKSLEYDTDKIKREFDSQLKDTIKSGKNTIITSTGYVGKTDELSADFPIDSNVLYGENTDFKNMGDVLSGIDTIRISQAKNVTLENFSDSSVLSINLVEMNNKLLEQTGIH